MKYMIDIDGTICSKTEGGHYAESRPYEDRIKFFNSLYEYGNEIHYWTARGSISGIDWTLLTLRQLDEWGVKFTKFSIGKPSYDIWIDDKAYNVEDYFSEKFDNRR